MGSKQGIPSGLYTNEATCLGCGYRLRGLPEPRCPECGRPFDPDDPRTMHVGWWERQQREARRRRPPPTFGGNMTAAAVAATVFLIASLASDCAAFMPLLSFGTWIGIAVAWRRRRREPRPGEHRMPEGLASWRSRVLALAAPNVAIFVVAHPCYHRCPHATTVTVGPFALSYSTNGGPCGNAPYGRGHRLSGNWYYSGHFWTHR